MTAPALIEVAADPFAAMRALNRMRTAGFSLRLAGESLQIAPADRLTDAQRAFIRAHKPALVALLQDAEIVYRALVQAGAAGLGWMEGTPADWTGERLLAAGEVLYGDGRMVNRMDRRYCSGSAPPIEIGPEYPPAPKIASCAPAASVTPIDREAYEERAAIMEYDGGLPREEAERKALALAI